MGGVIKQLFGALIYPSDSRKNGKNDNDQQLFRLPEIAELPVVTKLSHCHIVVIARNKDNAANLQEITGGLKKQCKVLEIYYERKLSLRKKALKSDIIILASLELKPWLARLIIEAKYRYIPVIFLQTSRCLPALVQIAGKPSTNDILPRKTQSACDYTLQTLDYCQYTLHTNDRSHTDSQLETSAIGNSADVSELFRQLLTDYKDRFIPTVSLICRLGKHDCVEEVVASYLKQSYHGTMQALLLVEHGDIQLLTNVTAPENSQIEIRCIEEPVAFSGGLAELVKLTNARGNIVFLVNGGVINPSFVYNHVLAHSFNDCEVVIGPTIIAADALSLRQLSNDSHECSLDNALQDPINKSSFLNCTTSNFSIKAWLINADISLSTQSPRSVAKTDTDLDSIDLDGIEMGYALYQQGLRYKYIQHALTIKLKIPVEPDEVVHESAGAIAALNSFHARYPEFALVARYWLTNLNNHILTSGNLHENIVANDCDLPANSPKHCLRLSPTPSNKKRLKILTYRWHVPHQYELYKMPHDFTLINDLGTRLCRRWELSHRPLPDNACFKSINDININDYDMALLHFDENVLAPENTNGFIGSDWGRHFTWFMDNVNLPKVAICHGTPQFFGQYDIDYAKPDLMTFIEKERIRLVKYLGDVLVINNSYQAQKEWQFHQSKVIWHGFDPAEFPQATYSKGILTHFGKAQLSRPHYRGYALFNEAFKNVEKYYWPYMANVQEPSLLYSGQHYARARFRNYVDNIREYSIFFNSTIKSPMPRLRGEAMMCGLVSVNADNHDVDIFIKNGINGFYSKDAAELRSYLLYLTKNQQACRKIGLAGRQLALDIFNYDRFLSDWDKTIAQIM